MWQLQHTTVENAGMPLADGSSIELRKQWQPRLTPCLHFGFRPHRRPVQCSGIPCSLATGLRVAAVGHESLPPHRCIPVSLPMRRHASARRPQSPLLRQPKTARSLGGDLDGAVSSGSSPAFQFQLCSASDAQPPHFKIGEHAFLFTHADSGARLGALRDAGTPESLSHVRNPSLSRTHARRGAWLASWQ